LFDKKLGKVQLIACLLFIIFLVPGCLSEIGLATEPDSEDRVKSGEDIDSMINYLKNSEDYFTPTLCPNEDFIVYGLKTSDGFHSGDIYIWSVGGEPLRIGRNYENVGDFIWAPNSEFVIVDFGTHINRAGSLYNRSTQEKVLELGYAFEPIWSQDSCRLAYAKPNDIPSEPPTDINSTDLVFLDLDTEEENTLASGEKEFYYMPHKWKDGDVLIYKKIDFATGEKEILSLKL